MNISDATTSKYDLLKEICKKNPRNIFKNFKLMI